jgi:hypothetical protein
MATAPLKTRLPAEYHLPQDVFVEDYIELKPGQHASLIGPNGVGKTTLGMKLLKSATDQNPQTIGIALAMKPHRGPKSEGRRAPRPPTRANHTPPPGGRPNTPTRPPRWVTNL